VRVSCIVVAAGSGTRFGSAKQFATLGGARLVDIAVDAARAHTDDVVLVLPPDVEWDGAPVTVVPGGDERSDSVRAGLAAISPDAEIVVVHDAARPLAPPRLFEAVIEAVRSGADGAIPGVPVDLYIPGCPPHPVTVLDGLLRLLGRIEGDVLRLAGTGVVGAAEPLPAKAAQGAAPSRGAGR